MSFETVVHQVHIERLVAAALGNIPEAVTAGFGGFWDGKTAPMCSAHSAPTSTTVALPSAALLPTTDQSLVPPNTYPTPRKWLYGATILAEQVTVVSGPGGIGKSTWGLTVGVELATGRSLLGDTIFGPRTVLYVNFEDPADEISRRLRGIEQYYGISPRSYAGRLHTAARGAITERLIIVDPKTREPSLSEPLLVQMEGTIAQLHAEVVVLDPLGRLMGADINQHRAADLLLATLNGIAERHKAALVLIAHVRKGGRADTDGAAATLGSTAIIDGARVARGMDRASVDDVIKLGWLSEPWRLVGLSSTKDNLAPPSARKWFELHSISLPNALGPYPGDQTAVLTPYTPLPPAQRITDTMRKAALSVISAGVSDDYGGRTPLSPSKQGPRSAVSHIAAELRQQHKGLAEPASRSLAHDVLHDLLAQGIVEEVDVKLPRHNPKTGAKAGSQPARKGLEAHWERTLWSQAVGPSSDPSSPSTPPMNSSVGTNQGAPSTAPAARRLDPQQ